MSLCVGFVGENGAGKSTALRLIREALPEFTSKELRFSATLSETLALWGVEQTRHNLQLLAQVMDNAYGPGTLSRALIARARNMNEDILLLDGVRWLTDEEAVRSFPLNIIVYVTAPQQVRYERLVKRNEKVGEGVMSFGQFLKEDSAPNEVYAAQIGSRADIRIANSVTEQSILPVVLLIREMLKR